MTRQIMTMNKINKCHVNETGEDAGWFNYEAGTAYEAGTLVFDSTSNAFWCSIVPIEATDTDTPLEAPDKWAFVPVLIL